MGVGLGGVAAARAEDRGREHPLLRARASAPATCALRAISRLLPEEVRYEALEGLLKTRMSQHAHDKACRGYRASYLAASSLESLAGGQY